MSSHVVEMNMNTDQLLLLVEHLVASYLSFVNSVRESDGGGGVVPLPGFEKTHFPVVRRQLILCDTLLGKLCQATMITSIESALSI